MKRRQEIASLPDFPVVTFELGYRQTIDKATQRAVIEEIGRICPNKRVYLGIKWLTTYISIRPGEMIMLKEGEIDLGNGYLYFPHPKERKFKSVPILPEDIEILKTFTFTFPEMRFFRHQEGLQGAANNQPFDRDIFVSGGSKRVQISTLKAWICTEGRGTVLFGH